MASFLAISLVIKLPLMKKTLSSTLPLSLILALTLVIQPGCMSAQSKKVLIDVAHGQRFWNDPADMAGQDQQFIERVNT
jgi:hypothetical protein